MDKFLFHYDEWYQLYNCSWYDVDSLPLETRQHKVAGWVAMTLTVIFEVRRPLALKYTSANPFRTDPSETVLRSALTFLCTAFNSEEYGTENGTASNGRFPCCSSLKQHGTASTFIRAVLRSVLVLKRDQCCPGSTFFNGFRFPYDQN